MKVGLLLWVQINTNEFSFSAGTPIKGAKGVLVGKVYAMILFLIFHNIPSALLFFLYGSVIYTMYSKIDSASGRSFVSSQILNFYDIST